MAKKRKGSKRDEDASQGPNLNVGESRKRIRDFEDVADSDEEFHLNRDRILLDEEPEAKRRRKWQEQEEFLEQSDEEVLGYSGSGDEEGREDEAAAEHAEDASESDDIDGQGDDDEDDFRWGTSKDDVYGADEIETEEQALEEEAEALRLQKKQLQSMTDADYGFDEADWQADSKENAERNRTSAITEILPELQIRDDMPASERLQLLKSRYPEFEPLSQELLSLREQHDILTEQLRARENSSGEQLSPNLKTKFRAASAYLGALAMYFTLFISPIAGDDGKSVPLPASRLRDHPVMDSLVKCKDLWMRAKNLPADPELAQDLQVQTTNGVRTIDTDLTKLSSKLQDRSRPVKKSRAQRHAEAVQAANEARKAERMEQTEAGLADLDALIARSATRKSKSHGNAERHSDDDEEAPLTAQEAAEKAKRKKSLRFYTSQIAQKANRRGAAGRNAGGDDDIPHRERLRDRQARLNAEAEKRGRKTAETGAELGGESDEEDSRQVQAIRAEADDDYYDLISARTEKKKADKVAFAEAKKQAALQGGRVVPEETVGSDGKRKVTYAIEKNKGLTPHRKKEARNPRVKKRKKFEEKKKKLRSMKPVYKGGEGRGGYGGELTGIKKGVVKSTKL